MSETRTRSQRWPAPARLLSPIVLLAGLLLAVAATRGSATPAEAIAPCVPHSNTAEEMQLLGMVQQWRATNVPGAPSLTLSTSLNAAAAGYAQFLVNTPGASGHFADGSDWSGRSAACGFASNSSGRAVGGEGLSSADSASAALAEMAQHTGSGIYVPANVGLPVKCAGVAKATSGDGTKTRWVVLLMARDGVCPSPATIATPTNTTGIPTITNSPTKTATGVASSPTATSTPTIPATATATASPAASPTPTKTPPQANYGGTLTFYDGWNLITLPEGPLSDILDTATECYSAIYTLVDDPIGFALYSPNVPEYVNSFTESDGGAYWIESTGACTDVDI